VDIGDVEVPLFSPEDLDGPEAVADAVRAVWMLPSGPIDDLVARLEAAGVMVVDFDFGTPLIDAVSQWVPGLVPLLFVNSTAPGDRLRLTLSHELGHMVMHREPHAEMEAEANAFAAAFLMPRRDILPDFHRVSLERLAALKPYWKVSMQALLVHAYRLGRITEHHYRSLWAEMGKAGYRRREPLELEVARESPKLLTQVIDIHLNDLGYSPAELSSLVNLLEDEALGIYLSRRNPGRHRLRIVR
jgi:Zn-dependent peptidase ImmA (M78 family)